jgi:potassium-transporting ATPase KdpC subunit
MRLPNWIRQHLAAVRALLVLTVITGIGYPLAVLAIGQVPGLKAKADGSITRVNGRPVGSSLIGQPFVDKNGAPLKQYFQSRPSAASDPANPADPGDNPLFSGASNRGPEDVVDTLPDPKLVAQNKADPNSRTSLLTQVCSRSVAVGQLEGVDGSRPFCTPLETGPAKHGAHPRLIGGVGAVLSVIGPRDRQGKVEHPTRVVSVNEECGVVKQPFIASYEGVPVQCATYGQDYSTGVIVPIRGDAPADPKVPADAVTESGSGLDPGISPAWARLQAPRVAKARGIQVGQVLAAIKHNESGRTLGFMGSATVNVLKLNIELDKLYPFAG